MIIYMGNQKQIHTFMKSCLFQRQHFGSLGKGQHSINSAGTIGYTFGKIVKLYLQLTPHTKIGSKQNIRNKYSNFSFKEEISYDFVVTKDFLNKT